MQSYEHNTKKLNHKHLCVLIWRYKGKYRCITYHRIHHNKGDACVLSTKHNGIYHLNGLDESL